MVDRHSYLRDVEASRDATRRDPRSFAQALRWRAASYRIQAPALSENERHDARAAAAELDAWAREVAPPKPRRGGLRAS